MGAVVPPEFLAEIIRKYEKEESFYLRIELADTKEEVLSGHTVAISEVRWSQVFWSEFISRALSGNKGASSLAFHETFVETGRIAKE